MKKLVGKTHVAIMKKSWGLMKKILTGEKTIESRWYKNKHRPWKEVESEDVIYFKNSGEMVKMTAKVGKVIRFENLSQGKVRWILETYGRKCGLEMKELERYFEMFKNKKYCLLIFLKNAREVKPFKINKKGFGSMAAWLVVNDIRQIRL